jgi:hypothetical protein
MASGQTAGIFVLFAALPAVVLCWLAGLSRAGGEDEAGAPPSVEWYPTARIAAWAALLCGALSAGGFYSVIQSETAYRAAVALLFEQEQVRAFLRDMEATPEQAALLRRWVAGLTPFVIGFWFAFLTLTNLWLAAKVVEISGRLPRPSLDWSAGRAPRFLSAAALGLLTLSFAPGMPGLLAVCALGAVGFVFFCFGMAAIASQTQGMALQPILLLAVYLLVALLIWPAFLVMAVGLSVSLFNFPRTLDRATGGTLPPPASQDR